MCGRPTVTVSVAALQQPAPGQMTWLEDPPPGSALPVALLCFGNSVNRK